MILLPIFGFSQAPQKINFQSILRNTNGEVVANKAVSLRISILSGSLTGNTVYSETHGKTTDASGLISLQIGNGTVISGIFANIDWGSAAHFIKLEADFSGGSNFVVLGTQELMSVPYALFASKSDTTSLNLVNRFNSKVNVSDTSSMLANYRTGLNNKVNISDTSSMLANYRTGLNNKVNISDTSNMLANYRTGLNNKLNILDTTSLSNRINTKLNISDFPIGTTTGNIQYWNGTTWVNLAPGQNGQALILINGIPSWSGAAYPTLTTSSISSITSTSVNGGGNISSDGGASISARGLVYGTSANPTLSNTVLTIGSGTGSFSGTLTGLTPNTTYYIRAYATNSAGTGYGSQINFTTNSPTIATLTTAAISSLTSSAAIVGGNISTDGGASVTARGVVYGISPNPTLANSVLSIGSGIGSFSGNITGLSSSTSYYLRAFATNSVETAYGNQITFNTFPASNPITDFDGNTYQTIQIGSQIWMKENLRVTKYRNGDSIPNVLIDRQNLVSGAQSSYLDDSYYDSNFGKLYNWYAATDVRGICPAGWHLPSPDEWQTLRNFLGERPGTQLKENNLTYWDPRWQDTPTNSSGFSARGSGIFYAPPISREIRESGRFWSNMAYDNEDALVRSLFVDLTEFASAKLPKGNQISIRCLKDNGFNVTTQDLLDLQESSVSFNLLVYPAGGTSPGIEEKGIVYSTLANPTILSSKSTTGSGMGALKVNLTNLTAGTTYYARSFAKSSSLILYGEETVFSTPVSNASVVADVEGNTYKTIQIGSQIWMKENLRVTKYRNGDSIPNVLIDRQNLVSGAQSSYLDDSYYDSNFGKLYNWYAATDVRGICPAGWHLPSPDEWQTLRNFLGERPGTQLKENNLTYWDPRWQDTPTNSSGFSARGSGIFYAPPISREIRESGRFWSNMAYDNNNALVRTLFVDQTEFSSSTLGKGNQISLRCLKD
jgi:uncharacterized protein (TIGR02145 family)